MIPQIPRKGLWQAVKSAPRARAAGGTEHSLSWADRPGRRSADISNQAPAAETQKSSLAHGDDSHGGKAPQMANARRDRD